MEALRSAVTDNSPWLPAFPVAMLWFLLACFGGVPHEYLVVVVVVVAVVVENSVYYLRVCGLNRIGSH